MATVLTNLKIRPRHRMTDEQSPSSGLELLATAIGGRKSFEISTLLEEAEVVAICDKSAVSRRKAEKIVLRSHASPTMQMN